MRAALICYCCFFLASAVAETWKNDLFGVSINLPASSGWSRLDDSDLSSFNTPAVTTLLVDRNPARQSVLGINVVHQLPSKNLRDPATIDALQSLVRSFGYQTYGHANFAFAGRDWLNFPIAGSNDGKTVSGFVRFTSTDEHVFGLSAIGGGSNVTNDPEVIAATSSIRFLPQGKLATNPPAESSPPNTDTTAPTTAKVGPVTSSPIPSGPDASPKSEPRSVPRMVLAAVGVLIVIMFLARIIRGPAEPKRPNTPPPSRRPGQN